MKTDIFRYEKEVEEDGKEDCDLIWLFRQNVCSKSSNLVVNYLYEDKRLLKKIICREMYKYTIKKYPKSRQRIIKRISEILGLSVTTIRNKYCPVEDKKVKCKIEH